MFKFKINNIIHTVDTNVPPETSLNEYIRNYANLKGTKSMCLEGGCGACIVAVERPNPKTGEEEVFAVNSCLMPIFSCHGWNIITIEGIGNKREGYHKVQSTLAGFNGTQCGYCSPGMVMNMFSLLEGNEEVKMNDVENSFGGNMCRCTGYRPILDAFKSLASDATPELKKKCADIEDVMTEFKICSKTQKPCNGTCKINGYDKGIDQELQTLDKSISIELQGARWFRVKNVQEIYDIFEKMVRVGTKYMIVGGNTAQGVHRSELQDIYIDINGVDELHNYSLNSENLTLGANMSLTQTMKILNEKATKKPKKFGYLKKLTNHIDLIANVPVRNVATLAGNLSIKHSHREFPSDLYLILETVGAQLVIGSSDGVTSTYSLAQYLDLDMRCKIILKIILPALDSSNHVYTSYKIMQRAQNTHAYVNAGFLIKVDKTANYKVIDTPALVYGGINPYFVHATKTENYIRDKSLLDTNVFKEACNILKSELEPDNHPTEASAEYRKSLAVNLFYKFVLSLSPDSISEKYRSGGSLLTRPLSSGKQDFQTDKSVWPVNKPMPQLDAFTQCAGEAEYVNDIPVRVNELHAAFVVSKIGPGKLINIDTTLIKNMPGVVKFLSAKDIPGRNTFVEELITEEDEQLFADDEILYAGQPVGVVIAETQTLANKAADLVIVNIRQIRKPVLDLKGIVESGDQSREIKRVQKNATNEKKDLKHNIKGSLLMGGQYHYHMETQTCLCVPLEDGMDIYPASQWIKMVQLNASLALNMPQNSINVSVRRLGGGYGAKSKRSTLITTACAVAAYNMQVPVRMVAKLETNMEAFGKRYPTYGKYEVSTDEKGEIQRMVIDMYTDVGAKNSHPIDKIVMIYYSNCYDSSTWTFTHHLIRTDCTTNIYVRGPGSTEVIALIECIMDHIARVIDVDPILVRLSNTNPELYSDIAPMIEDVKLSSDLINRRKSIEDFNKANRWKKRGISLVAMNYPHSVFMPFHILISIYMYDGSVAVSHGGIEMGQGVNTKVAQAIAYSLGIDVNMIKIKASTSLTSPNNGKTGASMASDGVTYAALQCCKILLARLEPVKQKNPGKTWPELIAAAAAENVDLLCEYMYSPSENINYNIYGAAVSEVEVDLLTGQYLITRVDLLEDVGQSLSPTVDLGQIEGAYVMGLGYWLNEKLIFDQNTGALLTNRTWNYTIPGAKDIPVEFRVYFRRNAPNPFGVLRAKNTGEPPLCLSIGVVFAIRNALQSGREDAGSKDPWFQINLPYTPENVLLSSMTSVDQFAL
ncbi:xanthine dehydrogenase/oxidase-like [Planococcus citri]|uniref:xanthine dehydrogenase/oxidase-like n=1 Tax=Planococcus citri TaxID=170843 RepID=UPI0031F8D9B5